MDELGRGAKLQLIRKKSFIQTKMVMRSKNVEKGSTLLIQSNAMMEIYSMEMAATHFAKSKRIENVRTM